MPFLSLYPAQVDSTQNISEYDETTQAAIRKIMFEQKQKVRYVHCAYFCAGTQHGCAFQALLFSSVLFVAVQCSHDSLTHPARCVH
jgi:hypothetical protein